jgi:hypothetical protein
MSPEQALGRPLDHRVDLFSLAICICELLTLRPVFHGRTEFDVLKKVRNMEFRPPRQLNPDIPADLEKILLKAMQQDPEKRYASAEVFHEAVENFMINHNYRYSASWLSRYVQDLFDPEMGEEREQLKEEGDVAGKLQTDSVELEDLDEDEDELSQTLNIEPHELKAQTSGLSQAIRGATFEELVGFAGVDDDDEDHVATVPVMDGAGLRPGEDVFGADSTALRKMDAPENRPEEPDPAGDGPAEPAAIEVAPAEPVESQEAPFDTEGSGELSGEPDMFDDVDTASKANPADLLAVAQPDSGHPAGPGPADSAPTELNDLPPETSRRWPWLVLLLVLVAGGLAAGYWYLELRDQPASLPEVTEPVTEDLAEGQAEGQAEGKVVDPAGEQAKQELEADGGAVEEANPQEDKAATGSEDTQASQDTPAEGDKASTGPAGVKPADKPAPKKRVRKKRRRRRRRKKKRRKRKKKRKRKATK